MRGVETWNMDIGCMYAYAYACIIWIADETKRLQLACYCTTYVCGVF
jgi:hypothetical protein